MVVEYGGSNYGNEIKYLVKNYENTFTTSNDAGHKANIQEIPLAASATVGGQSLASTHTIKI
jgi:hypothetical protein